jgi:hypothetical protein
VEKVAEIWRFGLENELCLSSFYIRKYCGILGIPQLVVLDEK